MAVDPKKTAARWAAVALKKHLHLRLAGGIVGAGLAILFALATRTFGATLTIVVAVKSLLLVPIAIPVLFGHAIPIAPLFLPVLIPVLVAVFVGPPAVAILEPRLLVIVAVPIGEVEADERHTYLEPERDERNASTSVKAGKSVPVHPASVTAPGDVTGPQAANAAKDPDVDAAGDKADAGIRRTGR